MENKDIVNEAIENLLLNTGIKAKYKVLNKNDIDGIITIHLKHFDIDFNIEVKREIRNHHLPALIDKAKQHAPMMLIAEYIFPALKTELRAHNIAYLETPGNIYLKNDNHFIWIDTFKKGRKTKEEVNRAFTKTGLKVVFLYLLNDEYLNMPYREIAQIAGVGLGNINNIVNGLKEQGFIIMLNDKKMLIANKKELLEKWIGAFDQRLKPSIHIGNFRFLTDNDFANWKHTNFKNKETLWGGEPAGNLYTNYLNPEILTIYTTETRQNLTKYYRLFPDPNGNVKAYQKFWKDENTDKNIVPPILAYADLVNTGNKRNIETATMIFEKYLNEKFI